MSKIKINNIDGYDEFKKEVLTFFESEKEYPKWTGKEKFIIISDIPEEELLRKFSNIMNAMRPYMLLDSRFDDFYSDAESTERRMERFTNVHQTPYDFDENTEYCNDEIIDYHSTEKVDLKMDMSKAFETLTNTQKKRIIDYFYRGYTSDEISKFEGVKQQAIAKSINESKNKLKQYFLND